MTENFYSSDNNKDMDSSDQSQNLAAILSNMSVKLEGISIRFAYENLEKRFLQISAEHDGFETGA